MWRSASNPVYVETMNALMKSKVIADVVGERVYDTVQKDAKYPYVVVGENTSTPEQTSTNMRELIGVPIHVYSQAYNKYEAIDIMDRIGFLLNREFPLDDYIIEWATVDDRSVIMDIDEFTKHGIIRMLYKVRHKTKF